MNEHMTLWAGIYEALRCTPWWVYVLFVYLLLIGFKARHTNVVSLYKLVVIPAIFGILSIHTLIELPFHAANVVSFVLLLLIGVGLGYWQVSRFTIKVDRAKKLLQLPGSWQTLVLILFIFALKYYFGMQMGFDPQLATHLVFTIIMMAAYGITVGLFVGRFLCYLKALRTAESL